MFNNRYINNSHSSFKNKSFVFNVAVRSKKRKRLGVFRTISLRRNFFFKSFLLCVRKKLGSFFLKKYIRSHRRFLKRLNRNFFQFFLRRIGLHKHKFFLNKYFLKYHKFWNSIKKRNKFARSHIVNNKVPRFILKSYSSSFEKRTFNILLDSSFNIRHSSYHFAEAKVNNNLAIAKLLKKTSARVFLKQSALSGRRFLKYVVLFSKKGNQKNLFNMVFKNFLTNRFIFFKNIIKHFYHYFGARRSVNVFKKSDNLSKLLCYPTIRFSMFFRRLFFGQVSHSFYTSNSSNVAHNVFLLGVGVKFSKLFNSNLFLTSARLLNQLLSLFRVYIEIKPWKKSGRSITVPAPIKSQTRRSFIFSHWFKESVLSKSKTEPNLGLKVFKEFEDLSRLEGDSIKKLNSLSKVIQTNKAFIRKSSMRIV